MNQPRLRCLRHVAFSLIVLLGFLISPVAGQMWRSIEAAAPVNGRAMTGVVDELVDPVRESTVAVFGDDDLHAMGFVASSDGYIMTKLSELPDRPQVELADGRRFEGALISEDDEHDLALLKIDATDLTVLAWPDAQAAVKLGQWLASPLLEGSRLGVISAKSRTIPREQGVMGVHIARDRSNNQNTRGAVIAHVVEDSPADEAGMRDGDLVTAVNGLDVESNDALLTILRDMLPGDAIELVVQRGDEVVDVTVTLAARDNIFRDRNARMSGRVSARTDGYRDVLQHDGPLSYAEVGGPLVDLQGRIVGLNIARADRVGTYALPVNVVRPVVAQMLAEARGEPIEEIRTVIEPDVNVWQHQAEEIAEFEGDLPREPQSLDELQFVQQRLQKLLPKAEQATVGVANRGGWGSGVIISEDGYVLTAAHVVGRPQRDIRIVLNDGSRVRARTLGLYPRSDIALIKITDEGSYPFMPLGSSQDLEQGEWCFSMGHPSGFDDERGAVLRLGKIINPGLDMVWSDCEMLGGDSGGPLFDMNGRVVGINSRVGGSLVQNFHGSVDAANVHWDRLVASEIVEPPFMGVQSQQTERGVRFRRIIEDSGAAAAGLQPGDLLVSINGDPVRDRDAMIRKIRDAVVGDVLAMVVRRGDELVELDITLGAWPDER